MSSSPDRTLQTTICAPTPLLLEGRWQEFGSGEPTKSVTVLPPDTVTLGGVHSYTRPPPKTERGVRRKTIRLGNEHVRQVMQ